MNIVGYEMKRVHWSMNTKAMSEFKRLVDDDETSALLHMTPARYDILHLIAEYWWWTRKAGPLDCPTTEVPMKEIVSMLGLHPSTISKTVARMRHWELVETYRNPDDRRCVLVRMTETGWEALRATRRILAERPQNFLRVELGNWFRSLGMRDAVGSMRTAQRWGKSLASRMGLESRPIHDGRYDFERRRECLWQEYYENGRWRLPAVPARRRSYG